tara:strand:- start:280 stop:651 length:372 start_codon:yes stop_codon:yes gene_type:complete
MGTLTAFHNHQTRNTMLEIPGKMDLSAHVDFTAVAESAIEANLQVQGYFTQSEFLFSQDIVNFYHKRRDLCNSLAGAQLHGQLQTLLHPSQMGETIKVMLLSKIRETLPDSLKSIDRAYRLAS